MKINVLGIVKDHLHTLRNAETRRPAWGDYFVFFVVPCLFGVIAFLREFTFSKDVYNVSVTFFGIFIALMLNIQVAMFAIFQRKREIPDNAKMAQIQKSVVDLRQQIIRELNSNLSYLTLVSCVALTLFMALYMAESVSPIWASVSVIIYSHFMLTLLMAVKRSHAIFQQEYNGND